MMKNKELIFDVFCTQKEYYPLLETRTKKYLVRLPKNAKTKNDEDEKKLIRWAFEDIFDIAMDEDDIIRADIQKFNQYKK